MRQTVQAQTADDVNSAPTGGGGWRQRVGGRLGHGSEAALVPAASIAGRALITVVAIMTFLASLAAGGAVLVFQASQDWRSSVSREATIQVRPVHGRNIEADVARAAELARTAPGVDQVQALSKAESERLLEPWLGQGVSLDEIPVPRMIVVKTAAVTTREMGILRDKITKIVPSALLDDHRIWSERLAAMANSVVAIALALLLLIVTAMALAVSFATQGSMAGNREIIEVLHFVGASDAYISKQFQRRFLWLGLRGSLLGGCLAGLMFSLAGLISKRFASNASGEQIEALFGSFSIGLPGYIAIAIIVAFSAGLCGQTSRMIVFRRLRRLN